MDNHNPSPKTDPLQAALDRYKTALECLDCPKKLLSTEQALGILSARDALRGALSDRAQVPVNILSQVRQLDLQLKQRAYRLAEVLDLAELRASLPTPPQDWWWNLETTGESHPWDQHDWLLRGFRITAWTVNLGLLGTLATRFLSGGSGFFEVVAIVFPSIVTLLQARSELTEAGQKGFDKLLAKLRIPRYWQEEAKLGSTVLISALLGGVWFLQPLIAGQYNQEGRKNQDTGQLETAEQNYLRAIALNSENLDAHYNLGNLYEELQDFDNAQKQYLIAARGGLPDAYNNLARLYIQQKKYPEAVNLLNTGLALIKEKEQEDVKYSLFKNLGWARFEQGRYEEAQPYLLAAIGIASNRELAQYIRNPGAAHCLLAQVLEQQKQSGAWEHWQKCRNLVESRLASGEGINPEEDNWLHIAKKKLEKGGK